MPIFSYRCQQGHTVEALQGRLDQPLRVCVRCGASLVRQPSRPHANHRVPLRGYAALKRNAA